MVDLGLRRVGGMTWASQGPQVHELIRACGADMVRVFLVPDGRCCGELMSISQATVQEHVLLKRGNSRSERASCETPIGTNR